MTLVEFERARHRIARRHGGLVSCECEMCVQADWLLARLNRMELCND